MWMEINSCDAQFGLQCGRSPPEPADLFPGLLESLTVRTKSGSAVEELLAPAFPLDRLRASANEAAKLGRILSISSIARHGLFGASHYSAAKAGVVALTRTVALEAEARA